MSQWRGWSSQRGGRRSESVCLPCNVCCAGEGQPRVHRSLDDPNSSREASGRQSQPPATSDSTPNPSTARELRRVSQIPGGEPFGSHLVCQGDGIWVLRKTLETSLTRRILAPEEPSVKAQNRIEFRLVELTIAFSDSCSESWNSTGFGGRYSKRIFRALTLSRSCAW